MLRQHWNLTRHLVSEVNEPHCFQTQKIQRAVHVQRTNLWQKKKESTQVCLNIEHQSCVKTCFKCIIKPIYRLWGDYYLCIPAGGARGASDLYTSMQIRSARTLLALIILMQRDLVLCCVQTLWVSVMWQTNLLQRDSLDPLHGVDVEHIHSVLTVHRQVGGVITWTKT